ncbi:hypothetical protein KZ829_19810 [Actinoplanes hulinensis]|uniref:YcxB-like protein domain-containing protein n=1 Tax=Actinoplanes hulinensis TaxID=1144547 RepID=A0ABS7B4M6_9ACTN|nr:hypothetical protein [Actinoplanes hulinensis]MBW6435992.1 hypothetical protein [Actinoplanes hulinensis]
MHLEISRNEPLPPLRRIPRRLVPLVAPLVVAGVAGTALGLWLDAPGPFTVSAAVLAITGLGAIGIEIRTRPRRARRVITPLPETWTVTDDGVEVRTAESRKVWNWALVRSVSTHADRYRLTLNGTAHVDLPRPEFPASGALLDDFLRRRTLLPPLSGGLSPWSRR